MKKAVMLVALILGTSTLVNAETKPVKSIVAKENTISRHKKHRKARKVASQKATATKAETAMTKK